MKSTRFFVVLLSSLTAIGGTGCATRPAAKSTGILSLSPGTIGVVSTSSIPKFTIQRPLTRRQAGKAVADAVWDNSAGQRLLKNAGGEAAIFPLMLASPEIAATLIAKVTGYARGVGEQDLARADVAMRRFHDELNLQDELRAHVAVILRARQTGRIEIIRKPFPAGAENEFRQFATVMSGTLAWLPKGQTPQSYLASQGVDIALEIQLDHPHLAGEVEVNPEMCVEIKGNVRLWRVHDGAELGRLPFSHRSHGQLYSEWAANDAQALREEMVRACEQITSQIASRLGLAPAHGFVAN